MDLASDPVFAFLRPVEVVIVDKWDGRDAREYWNTEAADLAAIRLEAIRKQREERAAAS